MAIKSVWPSIEAEREPAPIRARREIVPGDYGKIRIKNSAGTNIAILNQWRAWTSEELREAAHLFSQLAEVLEENQ